MKLIDPTKQQLNAAFAERVAGWINQGRAKGVPALEDRWITPARQCIQEPLMFVDSADAVLPWLEKREDIEIHRVKKDGWQVSIMDVKRTEFSEETGVVAEAWEDTLPRAAVIAILRARGVEVEFTK